MNLPLAWIVLFTWLFLATGLRAAEIVVIYPRPPAPDQPIVYADSLDSTFVLGHLSLAQGELQINGHMVPCTRHGAFLAFLPVRKVPETKQWNLTLMERGKTVASATVPYVFQSDLPPLASETMKPVVFPRVIRVTEDNAHTRTAPAGSYHLFPVRGTPLLAVGSQSGFYEFRLDGDISDFIERRFAEVGSDSLLAPARIGDGYCRTTRDSCVCQFLISRPALWSAEPSADARSLEVLIYGARLALDRFRYSPGGYLQEANWKQDGNNVRLTLRFLQPLRRGYEVTIANDSLSVIARTPFPRSQHTLKGKRIVIDPGHGGSSEGAIGPLGTKEKEVTFRWARLLADELKRRGAIVTLTRDSDVDIPLHDRVAIARQNHADLLLSLHANALPDGVNPFIRHGTGVYFYQPLSRSVAEVLHTYLLKASQLADDGLYDANFAVVRPTAFPAVLLEAAYLIYPPEEELLRSETYLHQLARGVARGLGIYFKRQS